MSLFRRLPPGAFDQSVGILLSLIEHENKDIRIAVFDGLRGALYSSTLTIEMLTKIVKPLLEADVSEVGEGVLAAYVQACQSLQENSQAPETVRAAAGQRLSLVLEN